MSGKHKAHKPMTSKRRNAAPTVTSYAPQHPINSTLPHLFEDVSRRNITVSASITPSHMKAWPPRLNHFQKLKAPRVECVNCVANGGTTSCPEDANRHKSEKLHDDSHSNEPLDLVRAAMESPSRRQPRTLCDLGQIAKRCAESSLNHATWIRNRLPSCCLPSLNAMHAGFGLTLAWAPTTPLASGGREVPVGGRLP
jgi:hypothetical protein